MGGDTLNFLDWPSHMWGEDHPTTPGLKKRMRATYERIAKKTNGGQNELPYVEYIY